MKGCEVGFWVDRESGQFIEIGYLNYDIANLDSKSDILLSLCKVAYEYAFDRAERAFEEVKSSVLAMTPKQRLKIPEQTVQTPSDLHEHMGRRKFKNIREQESRQNKPHFD